MKNTDEISDKIKTLHLRVEELLKKGHSENDIIQLLVDEGIEKDYAALIIENVRDDKTDDNSFRNAMISGGFFLIAGIAINILSYQIFDNLNSYFFYLFWGIVVFGITTIIRGFILYKNK